MVRRGYFLVQSSKFTLALKKLVLNDRSSPFNRQFTADQQSSRDQLLDIMRIILKPKNSLSMFQRSSLFEYGKCSKCNSQTINMQTNRIVSIESNNSENIRLNTLAPKRLFGNATALSSSLSRDLTKSKAAEK